MAITATYTITPGSQPITSGARDLEDTVAIAFAGLTASTTYLATVSCGAAPAPTFPDSGDAADTILGWNSLFASIDSNAGVYPYAFTTGGAQTTYTINFVPGFPATWTVAIFVLAFSNTMTGANSFTSVSAA